MAALDPQLRTSPCPAPAAGASSAVHDGGIGMRPYNGVGSPQLTVALIPFAGQADIRYDAWGITVVGPAAADAAAAIEAAGLAVVTP